MSGPDVHPDAPNPDVWAVVDRLSPDRLDVRLHNYATDAHNVADIARERYGMELEVWHGTVTWKRCDG